MKQKSLGFLAVTFTLLALAGSAVAAQPPLQVNVPFAFIVHNTTLPAGHYTVEVKSSDLLLIRGDAGAAFVSAIPDESSKPSYAARLRFQRLGTAYVLTQVSGDGEAWDVPLSRSERALARNSAPVETVSMPGK